MGNSDAAEEFEEKMRRHVTKHVPNCLGQFQTQLVAPKVWDGQTYWAISCSCGGQIGKILGYSLQDLNPKYDGSLVFVTPLGFRCCECKKVTEIIDTDLHGYDGENKKKFGGVGAATYRGKGERKVFACHTCNKTKFTVTASFQYSDFDHVEDDKELESVAQDYFDWFVSSGVCASCGKDQCFGDYELA